MKRKLSTQDAKKKCFHNIEENQSFYNTPENQLL